MADHSFCRYALQQQMIEVRKYFKPHEIKKAWAYETMGDFEFHGPDGEYFYGFHNADCLWSAKAAGWAKLIEQQCPTEEK